MKYDNLYDKQTEYSLHIDVYDRIDLSSKFPDIIGTGSTWFCNKLFSGIDRNTNLVYFHDEESMVKFQLEYL